MQPVKYRRPRLINPVSVTLVALLIAAGYAAVEFVRVEYMKHEAYRVLEENGSAFAGRRGLYLRDAHQREVLRGKMKQELVEIGVSDPELETWIDVEPGRALLGVVYTAQYRWPFDIRAPITRELQLEHVLVLPSN